MKVQIDFDTSFVFISDCFKHDSVNVHLFLKETYFIPDFRYYYLMKTFFYESAAQN
jgi:hypothetical protein